MNKTNTESHCDNKTLSQWLCYLETIHSQEIDLGLTRIAKVAELLNIDLSFAKVITVAGTNGKGTTCAFLENFLIHQKHSVAVYSSPHIERFNERLRVNKVDVDDQPWIDALTQIEQARGDISLTYYEFTTLAGLLILQTLQPSYIILEVGLGGRLDATNIIDADIAVITSIDLDHQAFLGDTREAIGREKAGIFRANKPAIVGEPKMPASIKGYADEVQANLMARGQAFTLTKTEHVWHWQTNELVLNNLHQPYIPVDNAATALMVLNQLGVTLTADAVNQVIDITKVAGRTELFKPSPELKLGCRQINCDVMLDVAHNPHAARHLAVTVAKLGYKKVHAVVGMLKDKDITSTIAEMQSLVDTWYFGALSGPRAATGGEIQELTKGLALDSNCFDNVGKAYTMATNEASSDELVLVFGSFFTVAEIRPTLLSIIKPK